jgi:hypothetical protein
LIVSAFLTALAGFLSAAFLSAGFFSEPAGGGLAVVGNVGVLFATGPSAF